MISYFQRFRLLFAIWRTWRHFAHLKNRQRPDLIASGRDHLDKAADTWDRKNGSYLQVLSELKAWAHLLPPRSFKEHAKDLLKSLFLAVLGAIVIRSSWFELYHVPTGSMRPTILEQDRLIVTKTAFGLNRPLSAKPLLFDANAIQRGQIVTFTSQDLDMESRTLHFGLFPGHKRLVKRLWAKGGDLVYFYGGEIYILDQGGQTHILPGSSLDLAGLQIIPFVGFQGRLKLLHAKDESERLAATDFGLEILPDEKTSLPWGLEHYGQVRLISKEQLPAMAREGGSEGVHNWLKIYHSPRRSGTRRLSNFPAFSTQSSYFPLQERHLQKLRQALYTARFAVSGQIARRVESPDSAGITLKNVPDGIYEIFNGQANSIGRGGNSTTLPSKHPLMDKQNFAALFNAGLDFIPERLAPMPEGDVLPQRYAYFRRGALHVMNREIAPSDDPQLKQFTQKELQKAHFNNSNRPFVDPGPPPLDCNRQLSAQWMREKGLPIPPKCTLLLGDNHARSSDSRDFGFVPQSHIQGSPLLIFWPPSSVLRPLRRPPLLLLTPARLLVWVLVGSLTASHYLYRYSAARALTRQRPWRRAT